MVLTAFRTDNAPFERHTPAARARAAREEAAAPLTLSIHSELKTIEADWRRFERNADCTVFQTFDWLATWQRHVGERRGVRPAIAVARYGNGDIAFILPLAVERRGLVRKLSWLGQDLCDYNAPLLASDFSARVTPDAFLAAWHEVLLQLQCEPLLRHDWIEFEKMPETIGAQRNPFLHLAVTANPSNAHLTALADDWERFYRDKRSSATRRRDRSKRRNLSAFGDIRFANAETDADACATLDTLMEQKSRALARKGIADLFAPAGHREFFLDVATNPATRPLVHVSSVRIGAVCAAANFGMVFRDCYYHVLSSYADNELAHYGPGALHLRELMAHAIKLRLRRFDFTIGDEPYKREWSDTVLKLYDYTATRRWRGAPACWASNVRRRFKRAIKQSPRLWTLASRLRAGVAALRRRPDHKDTSPIATPPKTAAPLACVMGDMDLLRPLALAGIASAVVSRPGAPTLYSRYARSRLAWDDYANNGEALVERLMRFGKAQPAPPVLFYEEDGQVLLVSRHRERLASAFRFVVADAELVENLLDKTRFQGLAEHHRLPVPAGRCVDPATIEPGELGLRFPLVVKPPTRLDPWNDAFGPCKAFCAQNLPALQILWPHLRAIGTHIVAQELIPGGEAKIESYHCYVDQGGRVAGEFTGRKIRTYPAQYGHTSALEITDAPDVRRLGRDIVERLSLTGVAKLDFKRDPQGQLKLLEINPRFNLWHHAGAVAGVNIPALVYADLAGTPRPSPARARAGVRWCRPWKDFPAARAGGVAPAKWALWTLGCEAKSTWSFDDPLPFLRASLQRLRGGADEPQTGVWF